MSLTVLIEIANLGLLFDKLFSFFREKKYWATNF